MLLVDLNYNFEFDWFVKLSNNKLSDNNLGSELVGNRSFFKPITIEEINFYDYAFYNSARIITRSLHKLLDKFLDKEKKKYIEMRDCEN